MIRTGGDLTFSLSATPNKAWGAGVTCAPPSFGAGSSALTVNVLPPIVAIAPGTTGSVVVNAHRMIDGVGDYTITGTSLGGGITAAPVTGQLVADGAATAAIAITVSPLVPDGYYPLTLTATVDHSVTTFTLFVAVGWAESTD
jgi:hypothetical protein